MKKTKYFRCEYCGRIFKQTGDTVWAQEPVSKELATAAVLAELVIPAGGCCAACFDLYQAKIGENLFKVALE